MSKYLFGHGTYPCQIKVKTPIGIIFITAFNSHDLLTINEIFFRKDYLVRQDIEVVADIGSNIGISALYFLTQNPRVKCYLFEPNPSNVEKLKQNLKGFEDRYVLQTYAVSDVSGTFDFGIESTGRYGSLEQHLGQTIKVDCKDINSVLQLIINREKKIDLLKIDTEGSEIKTLRAINEEYLKDIKMICSESEQVINNGEAELLRKFFRQKMYGTVCCLYNRFG